MRIATCSFLIFSVLALGLPGTTHAVIRRHDVDEQQYIDFAANDLYESVGLWQAPGACSWSGATLIHPQWAITAAHCIPNATESPTFKLGASESNFDVLATPDDWFRNPDYSGSNLVNGHDFGLIHFPDPILDVTPTQIYRDVFEIDQEAAVIGYGRTGTGLTGEDPSLGAGLKRGATNWIDARGGAVGWTANVIVGDFDNPDSPAGNLQVGPAVATSLEGMIALYDSGGGWFINDNGQTKLVAVTSFRANQDNAPDSDYGDIWGSGRITRDKAWIDSHNAASVFWNNTTGNWNNTAGWDGGIAPTSTNTTVVNAGTVAINSAASSQFLFIDRAGTVQMNNSLQANRVLLKRGGTLEVGAASGGIVTLTGSLQQDAEGVFKVGIHGDANAGLLSATETVDLAGDITIEYQGGYAGPDRGDFQVHTVLAADSIDGAFSTIDGEDIVSGGYTYVGENEAGEDGVFRALIYSNDSVSVVDYLAIPGDANGDGFLDITDFNVWNMYKFTSGTDWSSGDFNGDGVTDISDFNAWNERKFTNITLPTPTSPTAPVPEPSSFLLAALSGLTLLALRRR